MKKIIFFTGGVYSSIGKGIHVSSIGLILKEYGFKVSVLKLDPYLNINSGLLSPSQHGEVYVTADGEETDLDLGHYERFLDIEISKKSCITAGKIYSYLLNKEINEKNNGTTVQVVPHVINTIHEVINDLLQQETDSDFLLIEVGGTIGDIESIPFLTAARHLIPLVLPENICFIHIVPSLYLKNTNEYKTKPAQHSINQLMALGILPNFIILKSDEEVTDELKNKIAISAAISLEKIIISTFQKSIYFIPNKMYEEKIHEKIFNYFKIPIPQNKNIDRWIGFTNKISCEKKHSLKLGIIGKYAKASDAYISIVEAFKFASYEKSVDLTIEIIDSETIEDETHLKNLDFICVPHGFGNRGTEGKLIAIKYARENKVPFLGICFGMQLVCIEYARNVLNKLDANSFEMDEKTTHPLFIKNSHGMRLGKHKVSILKGSKAYEIFSLETTSFRYRHRYIFNKEFRNIFDGTEFVFSGSSNGGEIFDIVELKEHPFFVAVQFHPEFDVKPTKICPLFTKIIETAINKKNS